MSSAASTKTSHDYPDMLIERKVPGIGTNIEVRTHRKVRLEQAAQEDFEKFFWETGSLQ